MDERQPSIIAIIYYNSLLLTNLLTTSSPRTKKTKVLLLPLNLFTRRNLDISVVYQLFQRTKDEVGNLLRGKVGFDERRREEKKKKNPLVFRGRWPRATATLETSSKGLGKSCACSCITKQGIVRPEATIPRIRPNFPRPRSKGFVARTFHQPVRPPAVRDKSPSSSLAHAFRTCWNAKGRERRV